MTEITAFGVLRLSFIVKKNSKGSEFSLMDQGFYIKIKHNTLIAFRAKTDYHGTTLALNEPAKNTIVAVWTLSATSYKVQRHPNAQYIGPKLSNIIQKEEVWRKG